ncbi:hypothetical protein TELCIR_14672 [Teladorsagia circumcincta]|uniref:Uncharacterized protein n=1 Tax=Teladorsagia circumcincta TaxID=45464 RepID=A0A2G9U0C0_TELCI|nr:hypothetical protein TELCIR_14672 [Teladorsagia circumcincta]
MDANPEFQPFRPGEDESFKRKEGDLPSTAIDIDSSMRARRPRRVDRDQYGESDSMPRKERYSGELVKDTDDRYRPMKGRAEEPAFEVNNF